MSVTVMDAVHKQVLSLKICKPKKHINGSHMVGLFEVLQSLRNDEVLCDIRIKTDDGKMLFGHKVVLISASPYFHAMFITNFKESNTDLVHIRELDSTVLQLLVNYIYTGEILITKENVEVLLPAANLLQLDYVKNVCVEFLQTQLDPSNCLGIKAFADLHNCMELLSISEAYIKKQFLKVTEYDEFLSLSSEEVIKLISCNDLFVPLEEKLFECVTNWVKHALGCRKQFFPELMEHVRLPLVSKQFILEKVVDEPLIINSPECKDYVNEALRFHLYKSIHPFTNPITNTIWSKPRQSGDLHKVILVLGKLESTKECSVYWYYPATDIWQRALDMKEGCWPAHIALISDNFVFAVGSNYKFKPHSVHMLDLSSQAPCWVPMVDMLVNRSNLGVGVLDNCIYAVGGSNNSISSSSVEVFYINIQKWRMVSSMSCGRDGVSVGVLNNFLYAVGGYDTYSKKHLSSVECYDPSLDTWKLVTKMPKRRSDVGIGVLDGIMYAIGGCDGLVTCKNVVAYTSTDGVGVWTTVADMHLCRKSPGVVTFDGLLYVIGGRCDSRTYLDSVETYNPNTNTWKLMESSIKNTQINAAVLIDRPLHFSTD